MAKKGKNQSSNAGEKKEVTQAPTTSAQGSAQPKQKNQSKDETSSKVENRKEESKSKSTPENKIEPQAKKNSETKQDANKNDEQKGKENNKKNNKDQKAEKPKKGKNEKKGETEKEGSTKNKKNKQDSKEKNNESGNPKTESSTVAHVEKKKISLFLNPLTTLYYLSFSLRDLYKKLKELLIRYGIFLAFLLLLIFVPRFIDGPHKPFVMSVEEFLMFAGWWTLLGVASSIGFGTGLHTFVLYLGPHIAKVTMAANECNTIPEMIPNRWSFQRFGPCPKMVDSPIGFWGILYAVQLEAFFWGFGTAIGELPPYFVARAAAIANRRIDELDEVLQHKDDNWFEKLKYKLYENLKKYGFITVLLCASVPNPLFDLAGITCGHFLIPFTTFFSATFIGKAIIKVHIQMLFVIFVFTKHHVESLIAFFEAQLPFLKSNLTNMINNQKKLLFSQNNIEDKPLVAKIWDVVIMVMIAFFLISIINSLANQYKDEIEGNVQEKVEKVKEKTKKKKN